MKIYRYSWGNNEKRKALKGRHCRILASGRKNSVKIQFLDNGQAEIVSRNALKRMDGIQADLFDLNQDP